MGKPWIFLAGMGILGILPGCQPPAGLMVDVHESAALANLVQASSCQQIFLMEHDGIPAKTFDELKDLLKPELAAATSPVKAHQGYYFAALPTLDPHSFRLVAIPAQYGTSGRRTFLATEDGSIFARDLEGSAVAAAPSDPEREGWRRIRGGARVIGPEGEQGSPR